jgi:hypothetical protein
VLGAGVSGLTSAVALLEAGHRVQLVAAEPSLATTSALAAAVWFPTHVGPRERVLRWGRETFRVLAEQAAAQVPGVVMRESLALPPAGSGDPEGGIRRRRCPSGASGRTSARLSARAALRRAAGRDAALPPVARGTGPQPRRRTHPAAGVITGRAE